ncbi:MAG TPA: sulfide/dihydroorotate dehydrogenase-like FAD/NAD-binding protein [Firmicutes bacterium]|nr:sulfide/dihydroorotate dehydrogenase-like FAD/NAD-binding protein [Bacillota bacterium]
MARIIEKKQLANKINLYVVEAPRIARNAQPGQFIVLRLTEQGERIPLTIADYDRERGAITLVVQEVGKSTAQMALMEPGDDILDLLGPLGTPIEIKKVGRVACVCGGLGAAPIYPKAKALKEAGNEIVTFLGAQTEAMLILRDELSAVSSEMYYATDDGSLGSKGFVTGPLQEYLAAGNQVDEVIAVGPVPMMRSVCNVTKEYGIPTIVSLNAVMVDGTGMCGGCRVTVGGETKFTCTDGPAFDGHLVDFDELSARQRFYRKAEQVSMQEHVCRIGLGGNE